ncbi:DUF1460 domain-containing protein [bacterium]|nr:MAG: DUF1460 domain-containing protein [bacterium]
MLSRRDLFAAMAALAVPSWSGDGPVIRGRAVFDRLLEQSEREGWAVLSLGDCIGKVGLALLGTPYVGGTLERPDGRELCTLDLQGLDCVTLFETSLNFARMLRMKQSTVESLAARIEQTRYRDGKREDYLSRLHYTLDWFANNEEKGYIRILTPNLPGSRRFEKRLTFMSDHPGSYPALRSGDLGRLRKLESTATGKGFFCVPMSDVEGAEPLLQTGDIVGWATSVEGLDIAHTGLILRDEAGPRFLHASSRMKKVVLDERVSRYEAGRNIVGLVVARPI